MRRGDRTVTRAAPTAWLSGRLENLARGKPDHRTGPRRSDRLSPRRDLLNKSFTVTLGFKGY
eukprot:500610-Hanusia_phi.AAC.1